MKTIYIVRHAKSSWEEIGLKDEERSLKKKGVDDAHHKAKILSLGNLSIDMILTSPAFRALNTAIIFAKDLRYSFDKILLNESVYHASKEQLLDVAQSIENKYSCVMLVGHDPGLTSFVNYIAESNFEKIPTSGVVCIEFEISEWKKIEKKSGIVKFYDFSKPAMQ